MAGITKDIGGVALKTFRLTAALVSIAALSACGLTPNDGPRSNSYGQGAAERVTGGNPDGTRKNLPFLLVDVDAKTVDVLDRYEDASFFKGAFTDRRSAVDVRVGFGDVLSVTIFEAGTGGLFVPTGGTLNSGNFVKIPEQEVDRTGSIRVPYAAKNNDGGVIKVYGRRPSDIQADIEQRLANRAIEPQVIVTVVNRQSNLFSVLGDVNSAGRFNITHNGVRVLDAITNAGGSTSNPYSTLITLQRGTKTATARMSTLINEPANNIFLRPNDVISVKAEERYYNIYGAVGSNQRVPFDSPDLSLADAIAKAGGLLNERADPSSVILYRREQADAAKSLGASLAQFKYQREVPTVYRMDMTQPDSFFLAQQMQLNDGDMIYVASHPLNDVRHLLGIVRDILLIRLIED